jgi:hypothetical protein
MRPAVPLAMALDRRSQWKRRRPFHELFVIGWRDLWQESSVHESPHDIRRWLTNVHGNIAKDHLGRLPNGKRVDVIWRFLQIF